MFTSIRNSQFVINNDLIQRSRIVCLRIWAHLTGHFLDCFERGDALNWLENKVGHRITFHLSDRSIALMVEALYPNGWEGFVDRIRHTPEFEQNFKEAESA
jgi:hypothetical protein